MTWLHTHKTELSHWKDPDIWIKVPPVFCVYSGCIRIAGEVQMLSHSLELVLFSGHSVLVEYKENRTPKENLEQNDSVNPPHTAPCGNLTSLFLSFNNRQQKEGRKANNLLVLPVNLAPSPATPSSHVWYWLKVVCLSASNLYLLWGQKFMGEIQMNLQLSLKKLYLSWPCLHCGLCALLTSTHF